MSQVFISYRQTDDAQKQRVRAFAERLRNTGIEVILDQFFLDDNPAGPNEGWPKWSSDRALKTDYVLIVGTPEWYQCFEGTQPPGTHLGAACEASDIRTRMFKAANVIPNIRVVLFKDGDDKNIPDKLSPYHRLHAKRDFASLVRWLGGKVPGKLVKSVKLRGEDNPFKIAGALPHTHRSYIRRVCDGEFEQVILRADRLISISGEFGIGKSSLMQQTRRLLSDHQFFGRGLADLCGHDEHLFMRNFFSFFASRFGAIHGWDELEDHVNCCPSVLFLDDIGEVGAPGLNALIPALVARLTEGEIKLRVIATSSQPLQTIFAARGLANRKYSKPWTRIMVRTCSPAEARKLLELLPARSRAIVMGKLSNVERISGFAPQPLQCLFSRLYDGECEGLADEELSNLVVDSANYE